MMQLYIRYNPFTALMYFTKFYERRMICNVSVQSKKNEGISGITGRQIRPKGVFAKACGSLESGDLRMSVDINT